jgi:putative tryptophan/tyrosine transport system substrate-binding protein
VRRRDAIVALGSVAAWPLVARARQAGPLVGFLSSRSPGESAPLVAAFREGLKEVGYVEGQNVTIAFRWADGDYTRLAPMAADLAGQRVAVIVTVGGEVTALAAKTAAATIPIGHCWRIRRTG